MDTYKLAAFYFAIISFVTIIVTVIDKINAKRSRRRIPEDFLMTLAILGGSVSEYLTMKIIRHKTLHKKFMIGLPVITLIQIMIITAICLYIQRG